MEIPGVNKLEIRSVCRDTRGVRYDFIVDGENLAERMGIPDRPQSLAFGRFHLDYVLVDQEQFPWYDSLGIIRGAVEVFLGRHPPASQLDSGRAVLYRCHCGCDYCGVVSMDLSVEEKLVHWRNIAFEDESGVDREAISLGDLVFLRQEYDQVFVEFLSTVEALAKQY